MQKKLAILLLVVVGSCQYYFNDDVVLVPIYKVDYSVSKAELKIYVDFDGPEGSTIYSDVIRVKKENGEVDLNKIILEDLNQLIHIPNHNIDSNFESGVLNIESCVNCFGYSDTVITLKPEPAVLESFDQYIYFSNDVFYLEGSGYPYADQYISTYKFLNEYFKISYLE